MIFTNSSLSGRFKRLVYAYRCAVGEKLHPLKSRTAPPSEPKLHPLWGFLSKLRFFATASVLIGFSILWEHSFLCSMPIVGMEPQQKSGNFQCEGLNLYAQLFVWLRGQAHCLTPTLFIEPLLLDIEFRATAQPAEVFNTPLYAWQALSPTFRFKSA